jgi:hypothetical protein
MNQTLRHVAEALGVIGLDTHMIAGSRACSRSTWPIHPIITS